ncbi:MAG TPA: antibiotic biosynthesis monooxygenase [Acidimicrobiia bacterium]|nr:antibiotic biosynthesis monooxygenase [Acidimicrobiia bacterium]
MSVVKINAIAVPEGQGVELERRFAGRARLVEGMPGFEGFELLRPVAGDSRYFVITHWADDESFQAWVESTEFRKGHAQADAADGKPVASHSALLEFEVVELDAGRPRA